MENQTVMTSMENVNNIFFISKGYINVYDKCFNLLTNFDQGQFFGEYQIMFGLLAGQIYRTNLTSKAKQ